DVAGWTSPQTFLGNSPEVENTLQVELTLYAVCESVRRFCPRQCGGRDGEYRNTLCLCSGLYRYLGTPCKTTRRPAYLQGSACSANPHPRSSDVYVHDGLPACRHLDTSRCMDATRHRDLLRLQQETQRPPTRAQALTALPHSARRSSAN